MRRKRASLQLLSGAGFFCFVYFCWFGNRTINNVPMNRENELQSCCFPFLNLNEGICGQRNCTRTCYDYLPTPNSDLGVESLGNEVFFHETSGSSTLNFRQACSVESLARSNPNLKVNVLMISKEVNTSSKTIGTLLHSYPNMRFRAIDLAGYFLNSPLKDWYFCTDWSYGKHAVSHLSDALRFLTLFKFGGYYFDLDFIVMRSLEKFRNFTAAQSDEAVAAGVIHFDYSHPLRTGALDEFRNSYRYLSAKLLFSYQIPTHINRNIEKQILFLMQKRPVGTQWSRSDTKGPHEVLQQVFHRPNVQ